MPKFFFDSDDGETNHRDATGLDLPDRFKARTAAIEYLPDIARDILPEAGDHRTMTVRVRDGGGGYFFEAELTLKATWLIPPRTGAEV